MSCPTGGEKVHTISHKSFATNATPLGVQTIPHQTFADGLDARPASNAERVHQTGTRVCVRHQSKIASIYSVTVSVTIILLGSSLRVQDSLNE